MTASIPKVAADFETSLDTSVQQGDTTATLLSVLDTNDVTLASGLYGFTIDNDTDYKEYIICSLAGTALTNIISVSDQGAATAGFANYHRRGASVEITDHVALQRVVNALTGVTGLDGGVPLAYDSTPALGSGLQLATVQYVLDTVNGGAVSFNATVVAGMAGETLANGDWVYRKVSDGRWYKTDADEYQKSVGVQIGKARGAGTAGNAISGGVFIDGLETVGTYAAFTSYYLSGTAGALATSAGTNSVLVGVSDGNSKLLVAPLPASAYLTTVQTSNDGTDQSQTTQNGTFSAGEANATTRHNKLAQSFIPLKTIIRGVNLYKSANTGTFTGTVTISIQADSAGSPSGSALATKTVTNALYLSYAVGEFIALFTSELTVTPGNLYWIVIETSTSDTSNCINLGTNTAGGYTNGSAKYNNTADGWVAISTIDLYFKTLEGSNGKAILADSTGFVPSPVRKTAFKNGTVATGTAIAHGLGKVPSIVRASYAEADNSHAMMSFGSYDVANNAYLSTSFAYNEATSGGGGLATTNIVTTGATGSVTVTITSIDENVVIFTASAGTPTIGYEITG